ncbi:hypothetical protein B0H14DRAFT_3141416 [Mycena olivaceomarginata]|nr:hypothetical protein B0H14DRAFT_3141416 [Mycena olivaceomarginata]
MQGIARTGEGAWSVTTATVPVAEDEPAELLGSPDGDVGAAGWMVDVMRPMLVETEVMTVIWAEGENEVGDSLVPSTDSLSLLLYRALEPAMFAATPLDNTTVTIVLHYISPIIQTLPQHLVASELAFRQSCLKLTPDDPAYLFWPSSDDRRVIDALESLQQKPIDDIPLDFEIRYTADDSLFAQVQLNDLRLVSIGRTRAGACENTPDSYWGLVRRPAPDREPEAVELERESSGSYWDMYNSVQGSGDSVITFPGFRENTHDGDHWSFHLKLFSRRTDDDTITVVNGTSLETEPSEVALKESLRGVWKLWKSTRTTPTLGGPRAVLARERAVHARQTGSLHEQSDKVNQSIAGLSQDLRRAWSWGARRSSGHGGATCMTETVVVELCDDVESSELVLEAVVVFVVGGRANDQSPTYRAMGD